MAAKKNAKKSAAKAKAITTELRTLGSEDLQAKLTQQRQTVFDLRFRHATAQLEKTSELKNAKRDVARILTVLQEKK